MFFSYSDIKESDLRRNLIKVILLPFTLHTVNFKISSRIYCKP